MDDGQVPERNRQKKYDMTRINARRFVIGIRRPQNESPSLSQQCLSKVRGDHCDSTLACGSIEVHTRQARRLTEHVLQRRRRIWVESLSGRALTGGFHIEGKIRDPRAAFLASSGFHSVRARRLVGEKSSKMCS